MNYEVQTKNDLLTGSSLIVRIPLDKLDKNAFYTILADMPDCILPFRHRSIDGQLELVYQIGTKNKLRYLSGVRTTDEYAVLWTSILKPLLDCRDWFMHPYAFLLSAEHLYYDKIDKTVSYIYIPSKLDCSDYCSLKEMAAEVSKLISVSDTGLENKVLRGIMNDFNPKDFLKMLESYQAENAPEPERLDDSGTLETPTGFEGDLTPPPATRSSAPTDFEAAAAPIKELDKQQEVRSDIFINFPSEKTSKKKSKERLKEKERVKEKESAETKTCDDTKSHGSLSSLFKKIKDAQTKEAPETASLSSAPARRAATLQKPQDVPGVKPDTPDVEEPLDSTPSDDSSVTQNTLLETTGTRLRYVGCTQLPLFIEVKVEVGGVFSIGRFDAAVGKKQSDFEFDKKTKAISRRHAVIERDAEGYKIIDLSSSAGTFLNDQKLPPNTPCELVSNCRVSFGNSGADYVWEDD